MQYMKLSPDQREEFMIALGSMPKFLRRTFSDVSPADARSPGPDGIPSPVEQVWHLADLEREGFGERIRRLLLEPDPHLLDFNGGKVAADRNYRSLSLEAGLMAFAAARRGNISALRAVAPESWFRSGTQEGVGKVSLFDIPVFISQHDAAHRLEIETWKKSLGR